MLSQLRVEDHAPLVDPGISAETANWYHPIRPSIVEPWISAGFDVSAMVRCHRRSRHAAPSDRMEGQASSARRDHSVGELPGSVQTKPIIGQGVGWILLRHIRSAAFSEAI